MVSCASCPLDLTSIFSISIDILQVHDNGYISFGVNYVDYTPGPFPIPQTIIAPFWADTDTSCGGVGDVYYRETTANSTLAKVANDIQNSLSPSSDFFPSSVVIATWHQVRYYPCNIFDYKVRIMDVCCKCQLIIIIHTVKRIKSFSKGTKYLKCVVVQQCKCTIFFL